MFEFIDELAGAPWRRATMLDSSQAGFCTRLRRHVWTVQVTSVHIHCTELPNFSYIPVTGHPAQHFSRIRILPGSQVENSLIF